MAPFARGTQTSKRGDFERVDDLVGDVLGLDRFDQLLADAAVSSVLTTVGITQWTSTPLPRSSARTASLIPTTACLVAGVGGDAREAPLLPACEAMLTMWPLPRGRSRSIASWVPAMTP